MSTTELARTVAAPRHEVYRALLDADAVQQWMVPDGMTSEIHAFDPVEGGTFRVSLTYDLPTGHGKTTPQTDTYHGTFTRLIPDHEVVQAVEFETDDPSMQGEMIITYQLTDAGLADGTVGTLITSSHEHLPPGVSVPDNELGWRLSMAKLARLLEHPT
jgi:uncharacterized protein YndB with AHSA1/START domain